MSKKEYDFSGWATVNDMLCADGRTIRRNAFKDNDGKKVPLVWNHDHNNPSNVLGHAVLENKKDGVYAYCSLNGTKSAKDAKILLEHGDIDSLSIYANHLKQIGGDVYHGDIKEVSIVLAGANPGALIQNLDVVHSDEDTEDGEAQIFNGESIVLRHSDDNDDNDDEEDEEKAEGQNKKPAEQTPKDGEKTVGDIFDTLTDEQKEAVYAIVGQIADQQKEEKDTKPIEHADEDNEGDDEEESDDMNEKTIGDIFDTLTDEQKEAVYAIVGQIADQQKEEDDNMKHNVFDTDGYNPEDVISHDDMEAIMADGENYGSLRKSALAHGFDHIDYLFPEASLIDKTPGLIARDQEWVSAFMNATHHTPFSKIKTINADITADEARAKGYIKGKLKKEEVIKLLRRTTDPTTVYKKQKIDRDDVIDITDFDVVAFLKSEMKVMLNEEIARQALIGDGRDVNDEDKIDDEKIRPIASDSDLYAIKAIVEGGKDANETVKNFIRASVKARKDFKGSGSPTLFASNDIITDCLLVEDSIGRRLYNTEAEVASALRVKNIVEVPVLENAKLTLAGTAYDILGVIVNPIDYNMGADKGGAVSMFDDFDIDYNKQIYLIETRLSGALVKPYSAIVLLKKSTSGSSDDAQG